MIAAVRSEKPADADRVVAIDGLLAPLVRRLRLDAPSIEGALRLLADEIAPRRLSPDECAVVVANVVATRKATVKPSDIADAVKARLGMRPKLAMIAGDGGLMARWPDVVADLERHLGQAIVRSWFSALVVDRIADGRAVMATEHAFVRDHVSRDYASQMRASLDLVFGGVSSVEIIIRRMAA